jgi:hypothetical protein
MTSRLRESLHASGAAARVTAFSAARAFRTSGTTRLVAGATASVLLSLAGCTTARAPIVVEPALETTAVPQVVLLPVFDARPSRYDHAEVARNVEDAMVRLLRERGYAVDLAPTYNVRPTGPIDVRAATADQILAYAPEHTGYFVFVQLERIEPGVDTISRDKDSKPTELREEGIDANVQTWDARVSALMVDRSTSHVVWRDVATASSTLGGVLAVFSRGSVQSEAAVNASRLLVQTLPDKRPRKK